MSGIVSVSLLPLGVKNVDESCIYAPQYSICPRQHSRRSIASVHRLSELILSRKYVQIATSSKENPRVIIFLPTIKRSLKKGGRKGPYRQKWQVGRTGKRLESFQSTINRSYSFPLDDELFCISYGHEAEYHIASADREWVLSSPS